MIQLSAYLVSEGYSLSDFLDYDNGMPLDHMVALKVEAQKAAIERRRESVDGMRLALVSLFDNKVIKSFHGAVENLLRQLGPVLEETREEKAQRSMRELNKLRRFMGGGSMGDVAPWEQG